MQCLSGTGFSREEAGLVAISFAMCLPTPSRLKPVPLCSRHHHFRCLCLCFCSSNAKGPDTSERDLGAGRAQVLRSGPSRMDAARAPSGHGCPFGAGPRSKTGAREPDEVGPNQEQAPLVTWGAFPSNSPKAKPEAVRPTPLILILI